MFKSLSIEGKLGILIFLFTSTLLWFVAGADMIPATFLVAITSGIYGYLLILFKDHKSVKGQILLAVHICLLTTVIYGAFIKLPRIGSENLELGLLIVMEGISLGIGFALFQLLEKVFPPTIVPTVPAS